MPRTEKHSPAKAAGKRACACAWAVFVSMAGTTMSFQVYHSIKHGHMPPPLAVLYGVVPLLISMLLIEVVSGWADAPEWARWFAFAIIGGAMFLSASASGSVVLHAAPSHSSLLFGLLLDGAAILAARFLMNAAKVSAAAAAAAAAEMAESAVLRAALGEEQCGRQQAEAGLGLLRQAVADADAKTAEAVARADELARQLAEATRKRAGSGGGSRGGSRDRKPPQSAGGEDEAEAPADLDSEARVLWYLAKGYNPSKAGVKAGLTDSRGRQIARLQREAPKGIDGGAP